MQLKKENYRVMEQLTIEFYAGTVAVSSPLKQQKDTFLFAKIKTAE
tara:strand:+ start:764 stop:901 length:138 start_codon:yes stop_codon:yes gene_type:complete